MDKEQIKTLIEKYLNGTASTDERAMVETWYNSYREESHPKLSAAMITEATDRIADRLHLPRHQDKKLILKPRNFSRARIGIAVAASIAIAVITGGYFYYQNQAVNSHFSITYHNDIAPGKNGGTLTLANGRKIYVNDALVGNIANEAGVLISKDESGQIVYTLSETEGKEGYNILSTTRGQQTKVRLPDGSLVFLNAASSLKYPISFTRLKQRRVELKGEGYFEVAKDKAHPFIVKTDKQEVEVLGTHFNINAYPDDQTTSTTLLEGSVRVTANSIPRFLSPGQQAILSKDGKVDLKQADMELAVAWKNNEFMFEGETIEHIMKMVERWYDVEIIYQGPKPTEKFVGGVSRFDHVSKVLRLLESAGGVHFKIEGRKIFVSR